MIQIKKTLALLLTVGLLAACESELPPTPEEIVAERAQARWQAMVDRDFEAAWPFYSPAYRGQRSEPVFVTDLSRRPLRWQSADVKEVSCEGSRCEVTAEVDYSVPGAPGVLSGLESSRAVNEVWIRLDGEWWYSPD